MMEIGERLVSRKIVYKISPTSIKVPFIYQAMAINFWETAAVPEHVNAANIDALVCYVISEDAVSDVVIGLGYADSAFVVLASLPDHLLI